MKEDPVARPITDTLRLLDEGAFLDRCSEQLAARVQAGLPSGMPLLMGQAAAHRT